MSLKNGNSSSQGSDYDQYKTESGAYECPECGESYKSANGLGAHRYHAHGVDGSSPGAVSNRSSNGDNENDAGGGRVDAVSAAVRIVEDGGDYTLRAACPRDGCNGSVETYIPQREGRAVAPGRCGQCGGIADLGFAVEN